MTITTEELIIDESNFDQYFFDARKYRPQKGQVLACYEAVAELVDGDLKRDVVNLLLFNDTAARSAPEIFQRFGFASYRDSIDIVKQITEDLLSGLTVQEVLDKPYEYQLKMFYYTKKEYIPNNDLHWSSITLLNLIDSNGESTEGIINDNE